MTILVTRPEAQAAGLIARIKENGGKAFAFPTLEITAADDTTPLAHALEILDSFDLACFISVNSVDYTLDAMGSRPWPGPVSVAAIGLATADRLRVRGVPITHLPESGYTSEQLLALPALQQMSGRSVLVFRGNRGRTLLDETLRARGATVEAVQCYTRRCPQTDPVPLRQALVAGEIDEVMVSSGESLANLVSLAGDAGPALRALPLVVPGDRVAALARKVGFRGYIRVADSATDEAMIRALLDGRGHPGRDNGDQET